MALKSAARSANSAQYLSFFFRRKMMNLTVFLAWLLGRMTTFANLFSQKELAYRVQARYRREAQFDRNQTERIIQSGPLCIDPLAQTVTRNGKEIMLTATEYRILLFLAENKNRIISKERLFEAVWNEPCLDNGMQVMVHIRHLRQKIELDPAHPRIVQTVTGLGYRMMETMETADSL